MDARPKILVMLASCLAIPVPAYAMIELLPAFFAVTGLSVLLAAVPVALWMKSFLIRHRLGQRVAVPWPRLSMVTGAEALLMAVSVIFCFATMESILLPERGRGEAFALFLALFFNATLCYSLLALVPNMWLLNGIRADANSGDRVRFHPPVAWILSLPLPCVVIVLIGCLVACLT